MRFVLYLVSIVLSSINHQYQLSLPQTIRCGHMVRERERIPMPYVKNFIRVGYVESRGHGFRDD